jgi:hypothetical protein
MSEADLSPVPIKQISVQIHDIGGYRNVHTLADLAGILMSDRWPKKADNTNFQRALAQCLIALEKQGRGDLARKAFVDAARDAGINVIPDDMPSQHSASPRRRNNPQASVAEGLPARTSGTHSRG